MLSITKRQLEGGDVYWRELDRIFSTIGVTEVDELVALSRLYPYVTLYDLVNLVSLCENGREVLRNSAAWARQRMVEGRDTNDFRMDCFIMLSFQAIEHECTQRHRTDWRNVADMVYYFFECCAKSFNNPLLYLADVQLYMHQRIVEAR